MFFNNKKQKQEHLTLSATTDLSIVRDGKRILAIAEELKMILDSICCTYTTVEDGAIVYSLGEKTIDAIFVKSLNNIKESYERLATLFCNKNLSFVSTDSDTGIHILEQLKVESVPMYPDSNNINIDYDYSDYECKVEFITYNDSWGILLKDILESLESDDIRTVSNNVYEVERILDMIQLLSKRADLAEDIGLIVFPILKSNNIDIGDFVRYTFKYYNSHFIKEMGSFDINKPIDNLSNILYLRITKKESNTNEKNADKFD